ncbi:hypothetical protein BMF94_1190 [Rhodotorula taiwanensis]|uniref:DUF1996 domain-containing protein n=1 Tax=Rhodotorula taiwanensis TaxID=741276 RepID=A0A2S5BFM2_9BASI|nr:hypothetical protein BMF94_1190 [Rhodotorula taiwanensis]
MTNPGAASGHVHTISGGSGFNLDMSFEDARASKCSSCMVKQDMSNYWTPALYFAHANGSFTLVEQVGLIVYYLPRSNPKDPGSVKAFPDGFRMLAGNPYKRSFDGSDMAKAIGVNCLGGSREPTRQPDFPPNNCPNGMRLEVMFPSCWDGKNVDSKNHQSHVAYPVGGETGPCPSGFPVRIETLFYEIMWSVDPWKDRWKEAKNTSQPFVLSTGDPTGYSLHGDFLNGWDGDVLQKAIDECTADSGVIEECKVFEFYDYEDGKNKCFQTPAIDESVTGTLAALPGCNPISAGPEDVTVCAEKSPPKLFDHITVFGGLSGGNHSHDVATRSSQPSSPDSTSAKSSASAETFVQASSADDTSAGRATAADASTSSAAGPDPSAGSMMPSTAVWASIGAVALIGLLVAVYLCARRGPAPAAPPDSEKQALRSSSDEARSGSDSETSLRH